MAYEVSTASNFNDLFERIVSFLTTDPSLVSANQHWDVLRMDRENLASITYTDGGEESLVSGFHSDGGIMFFDLDNSYQFEKELSLELKTPGKAEKLLLKSNVNASPHMVNDFDLLASNNNIDWENLLEIRDQTVYIDYEERVFNIPNAEEYKYFKFIFRSSWSSSYFYFSKLQLIDENNTIINASRNEVQLRGRGNDGSDKIFIGLQSISDVNADSYNIKLTGYGAFDDNVISFLNHPQTIDSPPLIHCWNDAMPYWFAASGRSFRMGVKVSTVIESAYLGLGLPYASPEQYPYPLVVAGSSTNESGRYSDAESSHAGILTPYLNSSSSTMHIWTPSGLVMACGQRGSDGELDYFDFDNSSSNSLSVYPTCRSINQRGNNAGDFNFIRTIVLQRSPLKEVLMMLEGIYWVSGFGNTSENTVLNKDSGDVQYVVLQDTFRTGLNDYWVIELTP